METNRFPNSQRKTNPIYFHPKIIFHLGSINQTIPCFFLSISTNAIISKSGGSSCRSSCIMDDLLGLLRIKVKRGIGLAIRDFRSSDPYVVIRLGDQRMKTDFIYRNLNPVWDEDMTLSVTDSDVQVDLSVFDHDTFTRDDEMGDAGFDIKSFVDAQNTNTNTLQDGTVLKRIQPSDSNCLSKESCIIWKNGKIVQNMLLKLRNVECGEIELELHWIEIPK